jgi:hypothetical protein
MIDITHEQQQQPLGYGDAKNRYGKKKKMDKEGRRGTCMG